MVALVDDIAATALQSMVMLQSRHSLWFVARWSERRCTPMPCRESR